jgi:hypothetical protein
MHRLHHAILCHLPNSRVKNIRLLLVPVGVRPEESKRARGEDRNPRTKSIIRAQLAKAGNHSDDSKTKSKAQHNGKKDRREKRERGREKGGG